jgi:hypothetical protein
MICLECAARHPHYKPLHDPAPMREARCQLCGHARWCVDNHKVGLPDTFLTADEAFKLMAGMIEQGKS